VSIRLKEGKQARIGIQFWCGNRVKNWDLEPEKEVGK